MKRLLILTILLFFFLQFSFGTVYFVSTTGSDGSGNGSSTNPWKTIKFALSKVPANLGHTIKISSGTFIENGPLNVPPQVNVEGAGASTIIKAASSFHYKMTGTWNFTKILFQVVSYASAGTDGNQSLKNFVIDGDSRKLYGGIMINGRNRVRVEGVTVQYCGFVGLWLLNAKDCRVTNVKLRDNAWHSSSYATASLCISNVERVEIDHIDIHDNYGAAIKAMGSQGGYIRNTKIHDNKLSTSATGRWVNENGTTTAAIVLEMYESPLTGNELYNNVFLGNVSLVTWSAPYTPKNTRSIRVYNNVFDCTTHANGGSYGLELSIHDAEIDHNYFYGGKWGITDFDSRGSIVPYQNWKIHHNIFYNIKGGSGTVPGIIRSERKGLRNVEIYNNTVEFNGQNALSFIFLTAGTSSNFKIKNNLIINNTTGPYGVNPPQFIKLKTATIIGLEATHNYLQNLPIVKTSGTYLNNLSGDPQINKTGNRADPYYKLKAGSPLIDKGVNVGFLYSGSAPDIGAYEYASTSIASTPPPSSGSNTIVVHARGVAGSESIQLQVNNTTIATWTLTTTMANYTATTSLTGGINVRYTNDVSGRDVQVDYIQVNGSTRQAEVQTVNTGVYQNAKCGGTKSEWLHCGGYIAFGNISTTSVSARLSTDSEESTDTHEFTVEQALLRFANPVNDGILRMEFDEELSEVHILDFSGRTMKVFIPRDERKLNEELGLLPGMYIIQPVKNGEKKRPQRLIVE